MVGWDLTPSGFPGLSQTTLPYLSYTHVQDCKYTQACVYTQMSTDEQMHTGVCRKRNAALESALGFWPSSPAHCNRPDRPKCALKAAPSGQPCRAAVHVLTVTPAYPHTPPAWAGSKAPHRANALPEAAL